MKNLILRTFVLTKVNANVDAKLMLEMFGMKSLGGGTLDFTKHNHHQSYSQYYRPSYIGSAISPETLQTR